MISIYEFLNFGEDDPDSVTSALSQPKISIDPKTMTPSEAIEKLRADNENIISKKDYFDQKNNWKRIIPFSDSNRVESRINRNIKLIGNLRDIDRQYTAAASGIPIPSISLFKDIKTALPYVVGAGVLDKLILRPIGGIPGALKNIAVKSYRGLRNGPLRPKNEDILRGYYKD